MKYSLKLGPSKTRVKASTLSKNSRITAKDKKSKATKSKATKSKATKSKATKSKATKSKATRNKSSRLIPQTILSRHPVLSKKRFNKRSKYISRNDVSPFKSVKERLMEYNSPLSIV
jgi:hypothetical protein